MSEAFSSRFVVVIDANRTVKDELLAAFGAGRGRRRISVTDLLNPRQAFFQRTHPEIQPSPERRQTMMAGSGFHEVFGRAVSSEEFVEQFVEFDGIVGKIDIYEDIPMELKTTRSVPRDVAAERSSYFDQLGMYCTMTESDTGRLLLYRRSEWGRLPEFRVFGVRYLATERLAGEMRRRRDLLRHAFDRGDPGGLPRCEWMARGCDYSEICGCRRAEPIGRAVALDEMEISEDPETAAALRLKLEEPRAIPREFRLNDLVFPRKAALERQGPREDEDAEERLADMQRWGFLDELRNALWFGFPGAFRRAPVELRSLRGLVQIFRDVPTILRASRKRELVDRRALLEELPHYFDRLAFECALTGQERGRVVIYYEAVPDDKFMVYEVTFRDLPAIVAEAERRLALLESGAGPEALPPCLPPWMERYCRFGPGCGCGAEGR